MDVKQEPHEDAHYGELHQTWLTAVLHAKEMVSEHGRASPEAFKAFKAMDVASANARKGRRKLLQASLEDMIVKHEAAMARLDRARAAGSVPAGASR